MSAAAPRLPDDLVAQLTRPRLCKLVPHQPTIPQIIFLNIQGQLQRYQDPCPWDIGWATDEVMYGGQAGGGKSDALLMAATQFVDIPRYAALILRPTYTEAELNEALINRARVWFQNFISYNGATHTFTWPNGATLTFGYLQHEGDKFRYAGSEFQFVGFDELTQFSETQYTFLASRLRKPICLACWLGRYLRHQRLHPMRVDDCPECTALSNLPQLGELIDQARRGKQLNHNNLAHVPLRMRAGTNPGGPGHLWVRSRFINPVTKAPNSCFIPAKLRENPHVNQESYLAKLMKLDPLTRRQLMDGDWDVKLGGMFDRKWFEIVDHLPDDIIDWIRYWDFAATEVSVDNLDPDWTAGTGMCKSKTARRPYCIFDAQHFQASPHEVEARVRQVARLDTRIVPVWIEEEPGASGKSLVSHYQRNVLPGYSVHGDRVTGPQHLRVRPFSAAAEQRQVSVMKGDWNDPWFEELEFYLNGAAHDDFTVSASGAFNHLGNVSMGVGRLTQRIL